MYKMYICDHAQSTGLCLLDFRFVQGFLVQYTIRLLHSTFWTTNDNNISRCFTIRCDIINHQNDGAGRGLTHAWGLTHSVRAYVNGWCSCHNDSCRPHSLFVHYLNPWKRAGSNLSRHYMKLCLHMILLSEISQACQSLWCHNNMVVLPPIIWKVLITNTSVLLVVQNKFYCIVAGNVLQISGTQINIFLIVSKAHSVQKKSYQFSFNALC